MADAEKYLGKFDRTSADKYDEFLSELGVNFLLRKAATVSSPVFEVHINFLLFRFWLSLDLLTKKLQILYINFFYMREKLRSISCFVLHSDFTCSTPKYWRDN